VVPPEAKPGKRERNEQTSGEKGGTGRARDPRGRRSVMVQRKGAGGGGGGARRDETGGDERMDRRRIARINGRVKRTQGRKRHEEGNNTARRSLRDGFGREEREDGDREDRRFGERTPLTRDWKVTRSCDCVWTAKFEGRKPTAGRSRPSPASIYPICRAIVFVKIINRYVSIVAGVRNPARRAMRRIQQ
jgi:hypothetical protein